MTVLAHVAELAARALTHDLAGPVATVVAWWAGLMVGGK